MGRAQKVALLGNKSAKAVEMPCSAKLPSGRVPCVAQAFRQKVASVAIPCSLKASGSSITPRTVMA